MEKINFGKVGTCFLFGDGILMRYLALKLKERDLLVFVVTGERYLLDKIDNYTLKDFLIQNNIPFEVTNDINSDKNIIHQIKEDSMGVSFGAPWIFKEDFIKLFNGKLLNSHSRDLPRHRGGGGSTWLILNKVRDSAALLHQVDTGIDTGYIVKRKRFIFPLSCNIPQEYVAYSAEKDKELFDIFIDDLINQRDLELIPQDDAQSSYFPRLHTLTHGWINWDWTSEEIIRFINAFDDPYCGASTYYKDKKVFLKKAIEAKELDDFHPFLSGIVYRTNFGQVFIAAKNGGIIVSEINDEQGKKVLDTVKPGRRFFTPLEKLEQARRFYAVYTSEGLKKGAGEKQ